MGNFLYYWGCTLIYWHFIYDHWGETSEKFWGGLSYFSVTAKTFEVQKCLKAINLAKHCIYEFDKVS